MLKQLQAQTEKQLEIATEMSLRQVIRGAVTKEAVNQTKDHLLMTPL